MIGVVVILIGYLAYKGWKEQSSAPKTFIPGSNPLSTIPKVAVSKTGNKRFSTQSNSF